MNGLTAERHALAGELAAAGLPTTTVPGDVLTLLTRYPAVALVERPGQEALGFGSATIDMEIVVWLLTAGPDDDAAAERLDEALLLALRVVAPLVPAQTQLWDAADTDMPGKRLTARRRIPYPTTTP